MERPDLDKVKRPVDEIKKAIDTMTDEEKKDLIRHITGDKS